MSPSLKFIQEIEVSLLRKKQHHKHPQKSKSRPTRVVKVAPIIKISSTNTDYIGDAKARLGAMLAANLIAGTIYKAYKKTIFETCHAYKGKSKYSCRLNAATRAIEALQKELGRCNITPEPQLCRRRFFEVLKKMYRDKEVFSFKLKE